MKRVPTVIGEEVAVAAGAVLGVGLPGADAPVLLQLVHALEVARLVGVDAPVQHQAAGALQPLDGAPHGVRRLDGDGLRVARGGDEGEHHDVGVGVEEHVLDEDVRPLRVALGRVNEVALHVEDEFALVEHRARGNRFEGRFPGQVEVAAGPAGRRVGGVEGEERRGGAAGGYEETAAAQIQGFSNEQKQIREQAGSRRGWRGKGALARTRRWRSSRA